MNEFEKYVHSELDNIGKELRFSFDSALSSITVGIPEITNRQVMTILVDEDNITIHKNYGQILYPKLVELIKSKMQ
ncbi:hypothetical protein [Pedobacter sp.]|uniref:hypothetical protein n=1 Tax=Pedobacter sp. TaxID=1411316 RepID=UPI003D7FF8EE